MNSKSNLPGSSGDTVTGLAPARDPARPPGPPPDANPAQLAAWKQVREGMLADSPGYAGRPEYTPREPAILDPHIQSVLDSQYGGIVPSSAQQLRNLMLSAASHYAIYLQSPAGLALTERLVKERYDKPVVTQTGSQVTLDFGILPGRLQVSRGSMNFAGSELREGSEWRSTEVGRLLQEALVRYPKATTITLLVEIPEGTSRHRYQYSYDRGSDRVTVQEDSDTPHISAPLGHDLGPVVRGERSLQTSQLPPR